MARTQTRLTTQGQISIPLDLREKLGIRAGSTVEWTVEGDRLIGHRLGNKTFDDVRRSLGVDKRPLRPPRTLDEKNEIIARLAHAKVRRGRD